MQNTTVIIHTLNEERNIVRVLQNTSLSKSNELWVE